MKKTRRDDGAFKVKHSDVGSELSIDDFSAKIAKPRVIPTPAQ